MYREHLDCLIQLNVDALSIVDEEPVRLVAADVVVEHPADSYLPVCLMCQQHGRARATHRTRPRTSSAAFCGARWLVPPLFPTHGGLIDSDRNAGKSSRL